MSLRPTKLKLEIDYKRHIRNAYKAVGHWSEAYEPGMGSGTGYPDIQMLSPGKRLLPVELKIGLVDNGFVLPREVRGDQVVWHREFWRAGGISVMAIGCYTDGFWSSYIVPGQMMIDWQEGYSISALYKMQATSGPELVEMVTHFLKED